MDKTWLKPNSKVVLNADNGCRFLIMDVALLDPPKKETEELESGQTREKGWFIELRAQ